MILCSLGMFYLFLCQCEVLRKVSRNVAQYSPSNSASCTGEQEETVKLSLSIFFYEFCTIFEKNKVDRIIYLYAWFTPFCVRTKFIFFPFSPSSRYSTSSASSFTPCTRRTVLLKDIVIPTQSHNCSHTCVSSGQQERVKEFESQHSRAQITVLFVFFIRRRRYFI